MNLSEKKIEYLLANTDHKFKKCIPLVIMLIWDLAFVTFYLRFY